MALELRSQLCAFENSTNCNEILFDPRSLFRIAKRSILKMFRHRVNAALIPYKTLINSTEWRQNF